MYLFVALELPKESHLLLDPPALPDHDNWGSYKLKDYIINNTYLDPLQECIHSEVCHLFRSTYKDLFQHIALRKKNSIYKIRNHLPAILPNQIVNTNRGKAAKIALGGFGYLRRVTRTRRERRTTLLALPGLNM